MPKKKKCRNMKQCPNNGMPDAPLQFDVRADNDKEKKVKPKEVFEGYGGKGGGTKKKKY
jgi:hypothetical protein